MKAKAGLLGLALVMASCGSSGKPVVNDPSGPQRAEAPPGAAGSDQMAQAHGAGQPSCAGMQGNECQGKNCCSALLVPGGTFPMGASRNGTDACPEDVPCYGSTEFEEEVAVSDFYLDEFHVTVGRFRRFVEAYRKPKSGDGANSKIPGTGWRVKWDHELPNTGEELKNLLKCEKAYQTWRDTPEDTEQHPINCVTWFEAFAFCAWDGGRLPMEAEWEYASAGGAENRLYPWGQQPPDNTRAAYDCRYSDGIAGGCTFADIAKVGSFLAGQGRWGHKDLAGNMWEWLLEGVDDDERDEGKPKMCNNCEIFENTMHFSNISYRMVRGGNFFRLATYMRPACRYADAPVNRLSYLGFRCARVRN